MKNTESGGINETNVLNGNVSRETILQSTQFKRMYKLFRKNGMSRTESLYNAAYLTCHNKYEASEAEIKNKYLNVPEHPITWANDKKKLYKHNKWSFCMKLLDGTAGLIKGAGAVKSGFKAFFAKIGRIPKSMDNSIRATRTLIRVCAKAALPTFAILLTAFTVFTISHKMSQDNYSLGVYIDGQYVGNTLNLSEIVNMKHEYESNLTTRYGSPVVLECEMKFLPQALDSKTLIVSGDMSIFDTYTKNYTAPGYGLYIDNRLAAVTQVQKWFDDAVEECISQQKSKYIAENSVSAEEIDKFVYNNDITIIADNYPESYFLSHSEVRNLFGLPVVDVDADDNISTTNVVDESGNNKFTSKLELDYSNVTPKTAESYAGNNGIGLNSSTLAGAITVDIAMERDEYVKKTVPYDVEYIYDDELPEGYRRLHSAGKDGQKIVHYKSTYQNNKLVKQEVFGEEITVKPVNKVIRLGAKELSEEEKSIIPTGTYIYPYDGPISSYFGWRILFGKYNYHTGLDIYGPWGDPIVAADSGEVIEVAYSRGYGNYILIQHDEDTVTRYAHCAKILAKVGDFVSQGDTIAKLGNTGVSTGVHVHFEIIEDGVCVDPYPYLPER